MEQESIYHKRRLFALAVLVLLILLVIFLIWWWLRPQQPRANPTTQPPISGTVVLPPQVQVLQPIRQVREPFAGEAQVLNLARNFTERYGSFSTDSKFQNLYDLFPSVTDRLRREFERTITSGILPDDFRGVETRVVQITIKRISETSADVEVAAQRVERSAGAAQAETKYQTLALALVKQGDFWYVESARWQ